MINWEKCSDVGEFSFWNFLEWHGRRIIFRGKPRRVRAGRRHWYLRYRGRRYRVRRRGRRSKVYFRRGWRVVKRRRGVQFLKYGRSWFRISFISGSYYAKFKGRKVPIVRFRVRFMRKWRKLKLRRGKRLLYFNRKWIKLTGRRFYYMLFRGRKLVVKKTRGKYRVRYRRRWSRPRRPRYGKRRRLGGKEIIII